MPVNSARDSMHPRSTFRTISMKRSISTLLSIRPKCSDALLLSNLGWASPDDLKVNVIPGAPQQLHRVGNRW